MSQEDPDPIASTQMFRAFTDRELEAKPQRRGFGPAQRAALYGGLLAVIVIVAVVVWLILR